MFNLSIIPHFDEDDIPTVVYIFKNKINALTAAEIISQKNNQQKINWQLIDDLMIYETTEYTFCIEGRHAPINDTDSIVDNDRNWQKYI